MLKKLPLFSGNLLKLDKHLRIADQSFHAFFRDANVILVPVCKGTGLT